MNKAKLKAYAPQARKEFIQMIRQRADLLGLTKAQITPAQIEGDFSIIEGKPYQNKNYANLHKKLAEKIKVEGLDPFVERIAYSWFNRFAALRFMEVNGFLSHGFRVLSNREAGKNEPEILTHAAEIDLPGLNKAKVLDLKLAGNKDAELYKMLLIAQCNELNRAMPFLFERINDESEILLPENLLATDSVIRKLVSAIDEADWAEVEIIGWLYQFYISEKKDEVIGKTVKSEDIPAATQLFTPNWIVKYMTQNSLGRLWLEANPHSQLAANMEFYIKPDSATNTHEERRKENQNSSINPEDIKVLDPACGSGHILVEAYELLKAIYTERGYGSRDIPLLILEKNLFGLDIDERAAQMASFALLMKARKDDRRIFEKLAESSIQNPKSKIQNVMTVPDSSQLGNTPAEIAEMFFSSEAQSSATVRIRDNSFLFGEMETQPSLVSAGNSEQAGIRNPKSEIEVSETNVVDLLELFEQGKTLGSLIRVPHGFGAVVDKLDAAIQIKSVSANFYEQIAARRLAPFVRAAKMLARRYDCVIANPPYMGGKGMNDELKRFAAKNFPDSKSDLFAMFIERNFELLKPHGFNAMVTMQSWMFLSSYEAMREKILDEKTIVSMAHLGARAFVEISGEIVQTTTFVMKNEHLPESRPTFSRLVGLSEAEKVSALRNGEYLFNNTKQDDFKKIPGSPIAYWVSDKVREVFEKGSSFGLSNEVRQGMTTTDNQKYLRFWFEVKESFIGFGFDSANQGNQLGHKWFPYIKGGEFRKWYGNNEYIVLYENNGVDLIEMVREKYPRISDPEFVIKNRKYFFQPSITWSRISSSFFGVRYCDKGFIFSDAGSCVFPSYSSLYFLTGLLCTKIVFDMMKAINPTLTFQVENVKAIPILEKEVEQIKPQVDEIVEEAVSIARADWDSFETSWDFTRLPMLQRMKTEGGRMNEAGNPRAGDVLQATDELFAPDDEVKHLTDNRKQAADEAKHLTDEVKHSPDTVKQLTDEVKHRADTLKQSADEVKHPADVSLRLTRANAVSVEECWRDWNNLCETRIRRMQELETENNRLFIEAYGLQDELSPEVPLSQITLARADAEKDTRRLLSYFIACLMGRYSLDRDGLVYADAGGKGFDRAQYQTFPADDDGIVPVTDMEWFPQEAARQFEQFVRVAWGEDHLNQNLRWIAEHLGGKTQETPIETVRRYFSTSFFKDHLQTYKKRPIYWLFSSGKQKAFECLVYLHRYNESTLPRMRHEYVLPLMSKLEAQIETLAGKSDAFGTRTGGLIDSADSTSEKIKLTKQKETLVKKQTELAAFDEKLRHHSDMRISLNLDDGVKVNYGKFSDLLAEVKQVAKTE